MDPVTKTPHPFPAQSLLWLVLGIALGQGLAPASAADWAGILQDALNKAKEAAQKASTPAPQPSTESVSPLRGKYFTLSADSTSNSAIRIEGSAPRDMIALMIRQHLVNSDSPPADEQIHLVPGENVSRKIYLRAGAGDYRLTIYFCPQIPGMCSFGDSFMVHNSDAADHSFLLPSTQVESDDPEIIRLAAKVTAGLKSDAEKSLAIHDWVARAITYDVASFLDGTYVSKPTTAVLTLQDRIAVCQGYSNLTAALHRASGIRAKVILGFGIPLGVPYIGPPIDPTIPNHAWNEVFVNGRWISMDVTWDSGSIDPKTLQFRPNPRRYYYDPPAETFAAEHRKTNDESF